MKSESDDDVVLVLSNVPDAPLAERIAQVLVDGGLAACVHLGGPITSVYSWQGKLERTQEIPLVVKTTRARQEEVMQALAKLHPYEVPEVLVVSAQDGLDSYLDWVRRQTRVQWH
ncbi:divalent cation tolerance protein CutA [Bordetella sp. FB-8]|uniref:divalent-cation tolerance protein CutA n=1 Tax=Bordetella sp. FB-8 TaxID=1159870 RepID=UPI00037B1C9F